MKIIGNTVGTTMPKPNLMQNDPRKGDFVKGKDEFLNRVSINVATADTLGGIKAEPATGGDTQPVRIGEDGKLYTAPGGTSGTATMHPLTFTGAVNATYDGSKAVEVVIPQGGGGAEQTGAEKIVDFTVDADSASATSFVFTAEEYPKLAQYNHLRGIFKKSVMSSFPWTVISVNNTQIAKLAGATSSMVLFDVHKNRGYISAMMSQASNPSNYKPWTTDTQAPSGASGNLLPMQMGELTSITVKSYTAFLDEGATIEIWGWNE